MLTTKICKCSGHEGLLNNRESMRLNLNRPVWCLTNNYISRWVIQCFITNYPNVFDQCNTQNLSNHSLDWWYIQGHLWEWKITAIRSNKTHTSRMLVWAWLANAMQKLYWKWALNASPPTAPLITSLLISVIIYQFRYCVTYPVNNSQSNYVFRLTLALSKNKCSLLWWLSKKVNLTPTWL